ncbi:hypothetical protein ACM55M_09710 [Flavobacterium sp. ZT3R25]|uniref:hypothetical protein n=1 Tax=Flavobacterium galactosi TaxID=3398735 RepID=UPI003A8374E1
MIRVNSGIFFSVYGIDAIITIINRLLKKENIFQPHRSHLYQYLANEMGYSHVLVAFVYAGFQLALNGFVIYMDTKGYLTFFFIGGFLVLLTFIYLLVRKFVTHKMVLRVL